MSAKAERSFKRAITQIILDHPFYASLLLNAQVTFTDQVPTMGTDGTSLVVNPKFVATLSDEHVKGVIIHEILHMIYMHALRRGDRSPRKFNAAADYAINPIVKESGFDLPPGCLLSDDYVGMTAEEIYNKLPDDMGPPPMDDLLDAGNNQTEAEKSKAEQDMKIAVTTAMNIAGDKTPDSIRKTIQSVLETQVDWRQKLRDFIQVSLGSDMTSWKRPNRNYLHHGMYLPSMEGFTTPNLAIMIDTSGSIYHCQDLFEKFTAEINKIVTDLIPEEVNIFYVDTDVQKHDVFAEGEEPTYEIVGGGGTCFKSAWPKMEETNPVCIVAFTDMYASFPEHSSVDTLWMVYGNDSPTIPFGEATIIKE